MSIDNNNQKYKKTSFLAGVNSDYIEEYYSLYLQNSKLLTNDWIEFFDGLKEDSNNILENIKGPSWNPKKIKKINYVLDKKDKSEEDTTELSSVRQADRKSVV